MNRYFTKENIWIANKNVKIYLTLLIIGEMQIEPQWDSIIHQLEWLILKRLTIPSVDEEVKELELLYSVDGNVKWQQLWKIF